MTINVFHQSQLRLRARAVPAGDVVELHTDEEVFDVVPDADLDARGLSELLSRFDGSRSVTDVAADAGLTADRVWEVISPAAQLGLVDDLRAGQGRSGLAAISDVEGQLSPLMDALVFEGPFWRAMTEDPESVPRNVYYGFALENWFFLNSETRFDSAVVSYPPNARIRAMMQEFFHEEHQHDDIVVRAFEPLGISKADLLRSRPLPTTTGLINLLTWWARTDPLFFMATVGLLEGRLEDAESPDADYDSFLAACREIGLDEDFVGPLRQHARVNASHHHGSVSREVFAELPGVDDDTVARWRGKAHLFVETYAAFFQGVLDYYSDSANPLIRLVERTV